MFNKIRKYTIVILSFLMLFPNFVFANQQFKTRDFKDAIEGENINLTDLEKRVLQGKGFAYRKNNNNGYDEWQLTNYYRSPKDSKIDYLEMEKIDAWANDVIAKSGALKQKTQRDQVKYVVSYIKSNFLYDTAIQNSGEYGVASQIGSIPNRNSAMCGGFAYGVVRVLDILDIESYLALGTDEGGYHATVRAYLDGEWELIEPTGYTSKYDLMRDLKKGRDIDKYIYPKDVTYVSTVEESKKSSNYNTRYVICQEKEVEDFLSQNDFIIFGYWNDNLSWYN